MNPLIGNLDYAAHQNKACLRHAPQVSGAVSSHCHGTSAVRAWEAAALLSGLSCDWVKGLMPNSLGVGMWSHKPSTWGTLCWNLALFCFIINDLIGPLLDRSETTPMKGWEANLFFSGESTQVACGPNRRVHWHPSSCKNYKTLASKNSSCLVSWKMFFSAQKCCMKQDRALMHLFGKVTKLPIPATRLILDRLVATDPGSPKGQLLPHAALD